MALKDDMQRIVYEVLSDLALPYQVQRMLEPYHSTRMWGITFIDLTTPGGWLQFHIVVGPVDESTLDRTKAELASRLLERERH